MQSKTPGSVMIYITDKEFKNGKKTLLPLVDRLPSHQPA